MNTSTAQIVKKKIKQIPSGTIFGYDLFETKAGSKLSIAKTLSRLSKEGLIQRLTKGKYYKPRKSNFGQLRPKESEVIKSLLEKDGKQVGYLTGLALYNRLGLTTQIPNTIEIAVNQYLPPREIEGYKFKFIKSKAPVNKGDIPFLQILDVLRNIKRIPGSNIGGVTENMIKRIGQLDSKARSKLTKLSQNYNPATRALLGAILEYYINDQINSRKLAQTLNPLSEYELGIGEKILPNRSNWNIK